MNWAEDFSPAALAVQPGDAGRLAELFREWGFRSLLAEVTIGETRQPDLI